MASPERGGGGTYEMQNFFNNTNSGPTPNPTNPNAAIPSAPYPPPQYFHNNNNNIPAMMNNSFAFPSSAPLQFHPHNPNPNSGTRLPFYIPSPQQRSPMASPPLDGARLMALLTAQSSGGQNPNLVPNALELPPPALAEYSHSPSAPPAMAPAIPTAPPMPPPAAPRRVSSSKVPRGRHLQGEHVIYDVDVRLPGEAQPQLEVSPIAKYTSERVLATGRQIAVNRRYICYGLRAGNIRILNIHTALRNLLRGHTQRVTDMAFFSEDVNLLASASLDGKIFVRKIVEDLGDEDKMQIAEQIILAIQITGDWDSVNPRVCWHSHRQDTLLIGAGRYLLKVDITKASLSAQIGNSSAEELCSFHVDNPIEGVYCMGKHNGNITDMSIDPWITTRLATASEDGTVIIWDENMMAPVVTFEPYWGNPVSALAFITTPRHPDCIVLLTAGPLGREIKLWVPSSSDGWSTSTDLQRWHCVQTLELKSSEETHENAFFNHVVPLPVANLILLANWKRNAIYTIHLDYDSKSSVCCMDYLAEFSVTMPILSITATCDSITDGEGAVQIFCVQTLSIQQYTLDLFQCSPPPVELALQDKDALISRAFEVSPSSGLTPDQSYSSTVNEVVGESQSKSQGSLNANENLSNVKYPLLVQSNAEFSRGEDFLPVSGIFTGTAPLSSEVPVPLSPRLSGKQPQPKSPVRNFDQPRSAINAGSSQQCSTDRNVDAIFTALPEMPPLDALATVHKADESTLKNNGNIINSHISSGISVDTGNENVVTASPTHLITPSELMSMAMSSDKKVDPAGNKKWDNREVLVSASEVQKVKLDDSKESYSSLHERGDIDPAKEDENLSGHSTMTEKTFSYKSSEKNNDDDKSIDILNTEQRQTKEKKVEEREKSLNEPVEDTQCSTDVTGKAPENSGNAVSQSPLSGRGKKSKKSSGALASSSASGSPFTSLGSSEGEPSSSTGIPPAETISAQFASMQNVLNQLVTMHKELQKQMAAMIAVPITKEGKRIETSLSQKMEGMVKLHLDAMWTKLKDENTRREKAERERIQQLTSLLNSLNKDLPATLERVLKKEINSLAPAISRMVIPAVEKAISSSINDALQKGINEKSLSQLEKSVMTKLDNVVAKQIQIQFQSSGKHALQDALRSSFDSSVIPAFERSCKAMFDQVDAAFQKGMSEHTASVQQQSATSQTKLASTLQEAITSVTSVAQSLKGELADGQRRLLALLEDTGTGLSQIKTSKIIKQGSTGFGGLPEAIPLKHLEESLDPTKEISRLLSEQKYEEAFHRALQMIDVSLVSWLCSQVDPQSLFTMVPFPLSQGVLLSLVQQLSCDLGNELAQKLIWIREAALQLNPNDPRLSCHMRPILGELYQNLHRQMLVTTSPAEASSIRLVLHVVNSILTACK